MIQNSSIYFTILSFLAILCAAAFLVEKKISSLRSYLYNPATFAISLTLFFAGESYLGFTNQTLSDGLLFLCFPLGAMICIFLWNTLSNVITNVKKKYKILTMVDLISTRFDNSVGLSLMLSFLIIFATLPYVAAQIKTFYLASETISSVHTNPLGIPFIILISFVCMFIGIRSKNISRPNASLMASVVFLCGIKILAYISVGIYTLYAVFYKINEFIHISDLNLNGTSKYFGTNNISEFGHFLSLFILSMSAFICLPYQFPMSVTENIRKRNIKEGQWAFPAFLWSLCIFVIPMAIAGIYMGFHIEDGNKLLLLLPLENGNNFLTMLSYLGSFSAAFGMILVMSVAVSTIISRNIGDPLCERYKSLNFLNDNILLFRRIYIFLYLLMAALYLNVLGNQSLFEMTLVSFTGLYQIIPIFLSGILFQNSSKGGAYWGLSLGIGIWLYTHVTPLIITQLSLNSDLLLNGPMGINWLGPLNLFGTEGLSQITHTLFWSTFFNVGGIFIGNLYFSQSDSEYRIGKAFILGNKSKKELFSRKNLLENIDLKNKLELLNDAFSSDISEDIRESAISQILVECEINDKDRINLFELNEFVEKFEERFNSILGVNETRKILNNSQFLSADEIYGIETINEEILNETDLSLHSVNRMIHKINNLEDRSHGLEKSSREQSIELEMLKEKTIKSSHLSSLGEMAGGIAHEINNPLAVIKSTAIILANLLKKDLFNPETFKTHLNKIQDTIERIQKIISGMKNLSRDSSQEKLDHIQVRDLFNDSLAICENKFKSGGIDFSLEGEGSVLSETINCKRVVLSQVIINFLNNSYDAIQSRPMKWIHVRVSKIDEKLQIEIIDSGLGIPQEIQDKIFEPFFTSKPVGKGTGLGLSLSSKFIKEHGGDLVIDSNFPHTKFIITIPLKPEVNSVVEEAA